MHRNKRNFKFNINCEEIKDCRKKNNSKILNKAKIIAFFRPLDTVRVYICKIYIYIHTHENTTFSRDSNPYKIQYNIHPLVQMTFYKCYYLCLSTWTIYLD